MFAEIFDRDERWIDVPSKVTLQLTQKPLDGLNKALEMQWMLSSIEFPVYLPSRILEFISMIINADYYEIYLYDFRKSALQLASARGFPGLMVQSRPGKKTIADLVFENARALNIPDLNEYPGIYRYPYGPAVRSVLSIPVKTRSGVLGVIHIAGRDANKFSIEDCQLLSILVNMAAALIQTSIIESLDVGVKHGPTGLPNYQAFSESLEQEIERARRTRQVLALMAVSIDNLERYTKKFGYFWSDYVLKKLSQVIRSNIREYDLICRYREHKLMMALPRLDRLSAPLMAERVRSLIAEIPLKPDFVNEVSSIHYDQGSEIQLSSSVGIAFCPDDSDESNTLIKMAQKALQRSQERNQTVLSPGSELDQTLPAELFRVKARPLTAVNPWDILPKEFLWLSLAVIAETFRVERASLVTVTSGNKGLKIEFARGISEAVMDKTLAGTVGIIGEVIRSEQPIIVEDIERDPRFGCANKSNYKTKSFMCVPIRYSGQTAAVVALADKESGGSFTEEDLNLATSLTTQIEKAIVDRRMIYVDAVAEMFSIVQDTRPYWKGHSKRVAKYARQIADFLELGKKQADQIEKSGLLHDLGDIKLDPHIFSKQGKLNKEEWEQIRQRPMLSGRICRSVSFLRPYEEAVVYLHKEPNGTGYPDNGNRELPDSARILAISEAFDAMISDRPYRSRMAPQEAIDELSRNARTWLDDRIINALQSVLDVGS